MPPGGVVAVAPARRRVRGSLLGTEIILIILMNKIIKIIMVIMIIVVFMMVEG